MHSTLLASLNHVNFGPVDAEALGALFYGVVYTLSLSPPVPLLPSLFFLLLFLL